MRKFRIIGCMTGNSMDAVDLVLTDFCGDKMTDVCSFSLPYGKDMRDKTEALRKASEGRTAAEILKIPFFKEVHDEYVRQIAECVNQMCAVRGINKKSIDAIGFHGKTLDHNPPSRAAAEGTKPYTLQIGSGKMLADLTGLKVVYDFRSDALAAGYEGAPLAPMHNAHIARIEGDGFYYNGGNTSNFALVRGGTALCGSDSGPFNEYTDGYIRLNTDLPFDEGGKTGASGVLNKELMQKLYETGQAFYEAKLPKSGDPAYYHEEEVFAYADKVPFADAVRTFEYFAAYIAVQALTLLDGTDNLPPHFLLFGGGWKNPVARQSFERLLSGEGYVLPRHEAAFAALRKRFAQKPSVRMSAFGDYMEARLFADMAYYKLMNKAWQAGLPGELAVCGITADPVPGRTVYDDMLSRAAKK